MGYKALITIDLPEVDNADRNTFYEYLSENKWTKIKSLTTAWKVSFKDDVTRDEAISAIKRRLKEAKEKSEVENVQYAFQLEKQSVVIGEL